MQYFKPAAGIIILIFILALIFDTLTSNNEQQLKVEQVNYERQLRMSDVANHEECIAEADFTKYQAEQVGYSRLFAAVRSGEYDASVQRCMNSLPYPSTNSAIRDDVIKMAEAQCDQKVEDGYLLSNKENIESDYLQALEVCELRHGQ